MAERNPGRWVRGYAIDLTAGDTFRVCPDHRYDAHPVPAGEHQVHHRGAASVTRWTLDVQVGEKATDVIRMGKIRPVEIWDPDGSVARRLQPMAEAAR